MDAALFWQIIEETRVPSMKKQEKALAKRLGQMSEAEILKFDELATIHYLELYSWDLWGVAHLYWGWCSDDSFMDWCHWIVSCGKSAFETARDRPDELVPLIDANPDAGCEGISHVALQVLRLKNRKWEKTYPEFNLRCPEHPRGERWREDDLKLRLPKTYQRFVIDASEQERLMKDPEYIKKTFNVRIGETEAFKTRTESIVIDGQAATRTQWISLNKKPWWRFW